MGELWASDRRRGRNISGTMTCELSGPAGLLAAVRRSGPRRTEYQAAYSVGRVPSDSIRPWLVPRGVPAARWVEVRPPRGEGRLSLVEPRHMPGQRCPNPRPVHRPAWRLPPCPPIPGAVLRCPTLGPQGRRSRQSFPAACPFGPRS